MFLAENLPTFRFHAKFDIGSSKNDSDVEVDPRVSLSAFIPVAIFLFHFYIFALERRGDVAEAAGVALAYVGRNFLPGQTAHDHMSLPFPVVVAWFELQAVRFQNAIDRDRVTLRRFSRSIQERDTFVIYTPV